MQIPLSSPFPYESHAKFFINILIYFTWFQWPPIGFGEWCFLPHWNVVVTSPWDSLLGCWSTKSRWLSLLIVKSCQLVAGYYKNRPEGVPASPHWPRLVGAFFYLIEMLLWQVHDPAAEVGCKQLFHNSKLVSRGAGLGFISPSSASVGGGFLMGR